MSLLLSRPTLCAQDAAARVARLAYRVAQRAIVLDVTRVLWLSRATMRLPPCGEPNYCFGFLSAAEMLRHAADPANQLEPLFAERILGGNDFCYAALADDHLAAYVWLALESIEAEQNRGPHPSSGVAIALPSDTAFVYKAYTRVEHRGRHLNTICMGRALEALAAHGVEHLLSTTDWTNQPALRSFHRLGFRDLGLLWRFGLPSTMFTLAPRAAQNLHLQFGDKATGCRDQPVIAGPARFHQRQNHRPLSIAIPHSVTDVSSTSI